MGEYEIKAIADHIREYMLSNTNAGIIFAADFNCHFAGKDSSPHTIFHNAVNGEEYRLTPEDMLKTKSVDNDVAFPTLRPKFAERKTKSARADLKALQSGYGELIKRSIFKSAYYEVLEKEPEYSTSKWRQGGAQMKKIKPASQKHDG